MEEALISAFIQKELARGSRERIQNTDNLIERGVIDSLGIVKLLAFLESSFGIRIPDEELLPEHFETVLTIAALVRAKQKAASGALPSEAYSLQPRV